MDFRKIKQVLWIIMFANLSVAVIKIVLGNIINSTSMTADGFHSLTDGSSNIIGLIGINLASKPVDKDHPYGHNKFEMLSSLFIATMLFFIGGNIIIKALTGISRSSTINISLESLIALILTLIINIFVSTYEFNRGKNLNSYILVSDSLHTRSDIFVSIGVLITLICIKFGLPPIIDTAASFVVALFILHSSYEIFKETVDILVDRAVVDDERVREIILEFKEIKDVHKIRSRGTESDMHIDMHIMTEPDMSVEESHRLIHSIERRLQRELSSSTQVIVHIEPFYEKMDA